MQTLSFTVLAFVLSATLSLSPSTTYALDNFAAGSNPFPAATPIGPNGGESDVTNLIGFTIEAGEPFHHPFPANPDNKTAWWRWQAPSNGLFVADTLMGISQDVDFTQRLVDSMLAAYEGTVLTELVRVAYNDDYTSFNQPGKSMELSRISFNAKAGTHYRIVVDGGRDGAVIAGRSNVRLKARFIAAERNTWFGIFRSSLDKATLGSLKMDLLPNFTYSAVVHLGGKVSRHRGRLDSSGFAYLALPTSAVPGLPSTLIIDPQEDAPEACLLANEPYNNTSVIHKVRRFNSSNPNLRKGYYTGRTTLNSLHAHGFARIAANGRVRGVWRNADNVVHPFSSQLTVGTTPGINQFEFYRNLLRGRAGIAMGVISILDASGRYSGNT